jgi:hypothetical protein
VAELLPLIENVNARTLGSNVKLMRKISTYSIRRRPLIEFNASEERRCWAVAFVSGIQRNGGPRAVRYNIFRATPKFVL